MDTSSTSTNTRANPESRIDSFVLRFVHQDSPGGSGDAAAGWYSVIRHVQSDTERHFTSWQDIVSFISAYVDLTKGAKSG